MPQLRFNDYPQFAISQDLKAIEEDCTEIKRCRLPNARMNQGRYAKAGDHQLEGYWRGEVSRLGRLLEIYTATMEKRRVECAAASAVADD